MSATIFDGKAIADRVYKKVAADVAGLATTLGWPPSWSVSILPRQSVCATSENVASRPGCAIRTDTCPVTSPRKPRSL
jgi:hypothetical protein